MCGTQLMIFMLNSVLQVVICTWNTSKSMVLTQMHSHVKIQNNCSCVIISSIVEVAQDKKKIKGRGGGEADTGRKRERTGKKKGTAQPFLWGYPTSTHLSL